MLIHTFSVNTVPSTRYQISTDLYITQSTPISSQNRCVSLQSSLKLSNNRNKLLTSISSPSSFEPVTHHQPQGPAYGILEPIAFPESGLLPNPVKVKAPSFQFELSIAQTRHFHHMCVIFIFFPSTAADNATRRHRHVQPKR